MVVLDKITEMKKQGIQTNQIIQNLKEEGISPKEINEALSQSEIKSEINQQNAFPATSESNIYPGNIPNQRTQPADSSEGMQPSLSTQPTQQFQPQQTQQFQQAPLQQQDYSQLQNQGFPDQSALPLAQDMQQAVQPTQDLSYQEPYQEYSQYESSQSTDIETINDISSQIIEEKTKHFRKEISSLSNFKKETDNKIKELENRLAKIENVFEELQLAIIKKIGTYGEDIKNLSHEMKATQNSFSKIIDPLTDNVKKLQKITGHEPISEESHPKEKTNKTTKTKKTKKETFEDYLR